MIVWIYSLFLLRAFLVSSSISFRLCSVESKFFDILSAFFCIVQEASLCRILLRLLFVNVSL
ncbi:hypothetical protein LEP1GSC016_1174 [Leptospira borgpetersenii serovar Hardjo-bovis str. Sponselee]|uniref:Uncharacterized protein n=1 Tax=Leptospira borgpetersenii serovar Hardjo-bovis str. Sponselee TaxID=1303729 RepID=M6BUN8_LEPBO|nr:hypothetical protein LEP1GSC016_1174 [Leptospira borgpetersenii serovar Hardjo-bovis str. Sponselee]